MFDSIFFDLDGLLVDSEPLQYRAFNQVFSSYGYPLAFGDFLRWRDWRLIPHWLAFHQLPLDPGRVRDEKHEVYCGLIRDALELKPGARSLVETAGRSCRLGIASGSRMETIESSLQKFSLHEHFEVLVSTTSVTRGKPFPDVFLEAAKRLAVHPGQSLVVENSANGLRAARAAGMACLVCPDSSAPDPEHEYADADLVVPTLRDVSAQDLQQIYIDSRPAQNDH